MNKKKKIILGIVVVLVVLVVGLVLSSLLYEEEPQEEIIGWETEYIYEPAENYKIIEGENVILVRNDNLGFSFEVPGDWSVERYSEEGKIWGDKFRFEGMMLFSPEHTLDPRTMHPSEGCRTTISIHEEYYGQEGQYNAAEELMWEIEDTIDGLLIRDIIEIDNHYASLAVDDPIVKIVRVPIDKKTYTIEARFSETDIEKCKENYNHLINSISFP